MGWAKNTRLIRSRSGSLTLPVPTTRCKVLGSAPHAKPFAVQGVPAQWAFRSDGKQLLVLVSYALTSGSRFFDNALVAFDVGD